MAVLLMMALVLRAEGKCCLYVLELFISQDRVIRDPDFLAVLVQYRCGFVGGRFRSSLRANPLDGRIPKGPENLLVVPFPVAVGRNLGPV